MSLLAEACRCIEENDPPIKEFEILHTEVFLSLSNPTIHVRVCFEGDQGEGGSNEKLWRDVNFQDPSEWGRLGRALGNNKTLQTLLMSSGGYYDLITYPLMIPCIEQLYEGMKHNTSIKHFRLDIFTASTARPFTLNDEVMTNVAFDGAPIFDLNHLLSNNKNLDELHVYCLHPASAAQCAVFATALRSSQLDILDLRSCRFNGIDTFASVLVACVGVKKLITTWPLDHQFEALATLLQDRTAVVFDIKVYCWNTLEETFRDEDAVLIEASLRGNNTLKSLFIMGPSMSKEVFSSLDTMLCDSSSIEGIVNSNHMLESLYLGFALSERVSKCLELNKEENKVKVMRKKILQYYCGDNFDITPFVSMPLSVLPQVIEKFGEGECNCQNGIFRLLWTIPDLCNLSSRS
jgi:hypothetical protein